MYKDKNQIYLNIYNQIKEDIIERINFFKRIWEQGDNKDILIELTFCLLTPQSTARRADIVLQNLIKKNLLENLEYEKIREELKFVRFMNNKARYIIQNWKNFPNLKDILMKIDNIYDKREWLYKNIIGMGMKESSHFLRNIGFVEGIAILDRHILRNLVFLDVISEIPKTLSKKKYLEIEKKYLDFCEDIGIPSAHFDFVVWYKENNEIFK